MDPISSSGRTPNELPWEIKCKGLSRPISAPRRSLSLDPLLLGYPANRIALWFEHVSHGQKILGSGPSYLGLPL